jgi:hypothetical protein
MKKVYKYGLPNHGIKTMVMPAGAELLHVEYQGAITNYHEPGIKLWAMVDERAQETEARRLYIARTGEDLPEERKRYIGTVLIDNGQYAVHVFELSL